AAASATVAPEVTPRTGHYRWVICALLFFATTINYVDRQVIGILAKDLQAAIGWSEIDYGNIVAAFNAAYALGLLVSGRLIDKFGTRLGYALAITLWSLAGMATSLARSAFGFGAARAALGLAGAARCPALVGAVDPAPADGRLRHRQVPDRPGLVVLPLLDTEFSQAEARA